VILHHHFGEHLEDPATLLDQEDPSGQKGQKQERGRRENNNKIREE